MVKNVFSPGTVAKSSEVNENFEYVEALAAKGMAQVPYTTLKATGDWENEGSLAADRFTTSDGVKNTVNTADTTSYFDTNKYVLNFGSMDGTLHNPSSFTNPNNTFDADDVTFAEVTNNASNPAILGKFFSSRLVKDVLVKGVSRWTTNDSLRLTVKVDIYDGTTWNNIIDQNVVNETVSASALTYTRSHDNVFDINQTCEGIRVQVKARQMLSYDLTYHRLNVISIDRNGESILVCEGNTLTLDGTESSIGVYNDSVIPADTSLHATISDGTLETDEFELQSNKSTIIPLLDNMQGDMKIKFILRTTDPIKSPEFYGYGVYKN